MVPLGMPLIAGPALLTALLFLIDTVGIIFTVLALLANLGLVAIGLCNADRVTRWMGKQGIARHLEIDCAAAGRHRRESDPARVADSLSEIGL